MQKQIPVLVLAVLLGMGGTAHAQTRPDAHAHHAAGNTAHPAMDVPDAAEPAVAVVERFGKALRGGDFAAVGALLDEHVLILESGGAERSRDEYLGHHAISDAKFLKTAHSQLLRRHARVEGDLAWVGSESELHASKDGNPVTLLSTETMILKRSDGAWRIVHIHWSSRPKH